MRIGTMLRRDRLTGGCALRRAANALILLVIGDLVFSIIAERKNHRWEVHRVRRGPRALSGVGRRDCPVRSSFPRQWNDVASGVITFCGGGGAVLPLSEAGPVFLGRSALEISRYFRCEP
jgi:hypothetical protein